MIAQGSIEIGLVRQECDQSCGVACAAMVAGKRFAEVRELVSQPGLSTRAMDELLDRLGMRFERQVYPDLIPHSLYIVSTPSLNIRGGMHWIVVVTGAELDGELVEVQILDPVREGRQSYMDGGFTSWAEATRIVGRPVSA